jgi:hypothetical protein
MKSMPCGAGFMIAFVLTPLGALGQRELSPRCLRLAEAVQARSELGADQVAEAESAYASILSAILSLIDENPGESVRSLCPELADLAAQYVDESLIDETAVTGRRRGVNPAFLEFDITEVPSDWKPFIFNGRTYYFVPLNGK